MNVSTDRDQSTGASPHTILHQEAQRLLEFKRQHIHKATQIACPQCAVLVSVQANKCPHCSSDIASFTAAARVDLEKLEAVTTELAELHTKEAERRRRRARGLPLADRLRGFFGETRFREDLKIILPGFLLLFAGLLAVRFTGNGLLLLVVIVLCGVVGIALLERSGLQRYITVDLYRLVLVAGLVLFLATAVAPPVSFWPESLQARVEVTSSAANIRADASTGAPVVASARRGDKLKVVDRRGGWYRVKTQDGKTGWVYGSLVK